MKLRSENSRADRAFNLACQIIARCAIGVPNQCKRSIRRQILDRIEPDQLLPEDVVGDMKATGDAANLLGISKQWRGNEFIIFDSKLRNQCLDYLSRSEEAAGLQTDFFNLPFLTERIVIIKKVGTYRVRITRLEEGLQAGCILVGACMTWFFAGQTELFQFGDFMGPEVIRKILAEHKRNVVAFNPTSSPLTKEAAEYITKLTKKSHLRYPFIRSRKFLVSATIVNRELLTASDQLSFQLAVAKLNEWAEYWCALHGFHHAEDFKGLVERTFGSKGAK